MDKVNMMKNKNRRVFFRIYDEVNLFYQKIDEQPATEPQPVFDNIFSNQSALLLPKPDLQFNEHETCNVNISASGMAFNCDDALKEGDYLIIKILLASGIEIIVNCKVVYSKNSRSSDIQHPYFVGTHFINMKDEDRELLNKHVNKKRLQQRWVRGFTLAAVITVIAAPGTVFGLFLEFLHFLFEISLHGLHLTFEFIEINLDHLIEHLFHTDLHQTQVIVFYIIASFVFYGLYRLTRAVPTFCRRRKENLLTAYSQKKASLLFYWQEQSSFDKFKLAVITVAAISCYIFFL